MTNEQAINVIEHGCIYRDKRGGEALVVAKSALERQIPKKPILDTIFPSGIKWWRCPDCGFHIITEVDRFCYKCGQALDWSDTE